MPTREAYEAMFVPELLHELQTNRRIKDIKAAIDKKNPCKEDYIELLMKLDIEGNLRRSATEYLFKQVMSPSSDLMGGS